MSYRYFDCPEGECPIEPEDGWILCSRREAKVGLFLNNFLYLEFILVSSSSITYTSLSPYQLYKRKKSVCLRSIVIKGAGIKYTIQQYYMNNSITDPPIVLGKSFSTNPELSFLPEGLPTYSIPAIYSRRTLEQTI